MVVVILFLKFAKCVLCSFILQDGGFFHGVKVCLSVGLVRFCD